MPLKVRLREQGLCAVIGQLHSPRLVEHQNAGAHALQDQRVEGFEADHFTGTLLGKGFADFEAADQSLHQQRRGKAQRTEGAGLQVFIGAKGMVEAEQEARADDAQRTDGGDQ
ncbi:hypothetical protein D3C81_1411930 [compost metagenome]